jgi:hypothetical protein
MKKIILLFLLILAGNLNAAFEGMEFGTRGQSLGPGFAALADDVSAIYYNPAGLAGLKMNEALVSVSKLYAGLGSDNPADTENNLYSMSLAYSRDLSFLHAGAGYYRMGLGSYYSENVLFLAAAKYFEAIGLKTGIGLKLMNSSYGSDGYTAVNTTFSKGNSSWGFGLDIGAMLKIRDISIGLSAADLVTTGLGLQTKETLPVRITGALAWIMPSSMTFLGSKSFTPLLGFEAEGGNFHFGLGAEIWFFEKKQLGVRFNYQAGNAGYSLLGLGVSYDKAVSDRSDVRFNYGFDYPLDGIKGTFGSHHVDVGFSI